jgi:ribonuclease-3
MTNYLETGVVIPKQDGTEDVYMIPYNINNILITEQNIIDILKNYNVQIDKINKIELFHEAFTHKSYVKKDVFTDEILSYSRKEMGNPKNLLELRPRSYERLEYFGDRVVKISVSFYLLNRYPNEDEGFMTRLQTKIEDKRNLAMMSKEMGLDKYFLISKQFESLNGRNLEKTHEDIFEAFMGALFNSVGFEPCCLLIFNLLETLIDYSEKLYKDNNYKDILLRHHHKNKWKFPLYHMINSDGPAHKRTYIMGVENPNISDTLRKRYLSKKNYKELCISYGRGLSKKDGEQAAAKMALILYGSLNSDQYEMSDIYYPDFDYNSDKNIIINNISKETHSIEKISDNFPSNELSDETDSEYDD